MDDGPQDISPVIPSELVEKTSKLVTLKPHLPSTEINSLVKKINNLLNKSIENELMFAGFVKEGALSEDGTVSNTAIAVHRSRKDSIAELVKVKMMLEGIATENSTVTHRFDTNGLVEALREARRGRAGRPVSLEAGDPRYGRENRDV